MKTVKRVISFCCLLLFTAAFPITASAATSEQETKTEVDLDARIRSAIDKWQVPGLAIVVVRDGKTVLIKGYGTRAFGSSLAIDADTYLQIASNSKAFTAYVIGMLVDEGRLSWEDPVKKYIPDLKLPDPVVAENVAIDDLLSHRSGLTEAALGGFQNPNYTIKDLLKELENTALSVRFRARNNYSQVGMALLGEIVQRASGLSWEQFVRDRIFEPLGMGSSYTSSADFTNRIGKPKNVENIMIPAIKRDGTVENESWEHVGTEPLYAPAGGLISNLRDMSAWIKFRLNDGVNNGEQLISSESLGAIRAPRIPADFEVMNIPWSYIHPCAQLIDVGYGHYTFEHRGRKVIAHNGGWMSSVIEIMPTEGIGVGIFSNAWFDEPAPWASLAFVNALALGIFDHYLGYHEKDWTNQMAEIVAARGASRANEGSCITV